MVRRNKTRNKINTRRRLGGSFYCARLPGPSWRGITYDTDGKWRGGIGQEVVEVSRRKEGRREGEERLMWKNGTNVGRKSDDDDDDDDGGGGGGDCYQEEPCI